MWPYRGVSLGVGVEVSKAQARPGLILSLTEDLDLSSQLGGMPATVLPCHDVHGLTL